jgi:hypothetical protein
VKLPTPAMRERYLEDAGRLAVIVVCALAVAIASVAALKAATARLSPLENARYTALLLTAMGVVARTLASARALAGKMRGQRLAEPWPPEILFASTGIGWGLLVPGALAVWALYGNPPHYFVATLLGLVTTWIVAGAAGTFAFVTSWLGGTFRQYLIAQSVVQIPAILFLVTALKLVIVTWRAIP